MCAVEEAAGDERQGRRRRAAAGWIAGVIARPWVAPVAILACFAAAATGVAVSDPTDDVGPSTCLFKLATGFDCPGCGGTRAFYYLLSANLPEAARHHAIAVFAAPFVVWMFAGWAVPRLMPKVRWRLPTFHLTTRALTGFLIAWGVFFLARNLPWEPFTYFFV